MPRTSSSRFSPAPRRGGRNTPAATVIDARSQKAWRAVRQVTELLPTFTSFARAISGNNKLRVQLGRHGAQTDGQTIWIFPQIAFGEERMHERHLCDRRGSDRLQLCKACAAREELMFDLFHEIAHVTFETVIEPLPYVIDKVVAMIHEWHPAGACSHAGPMIEATRQVKSYMELLHIHNGFLQVLFKSLEDARVNARMFKTRPGLKMMFESETRKIFETGVESSDGSRAMWHEAPLHSQIMVGLLLMASGYGLSEGYLSEEAVNVLADSTLERLAARAVLCMSAHHIAELSIDTFRALNEMGFCLVPKCEAVPPPPPLPSDETDDKEKDDEQSGDGSPGDGSAQTGEADDADPETGDESSSSSEAGSSDSDSSSTGADGGGIGGAEDQQNPDEREDADASGSNPTDDTDDEESDGESGTDDYSREDGSGDGESDTSQNDGSDSDQGDAPSSEDVLRGSDDGDDSSESEDGSTGQPRSSGAGTSDNGDAEDNASMEPSAATEVPDDEGDSESDGDDSASGESGSDESPSLGQDDTYDMEGDSEETWPKQEAEPDVSSSVWDDEANAEAAAKQYAPAPGPTEFDDADADADADLGGEPLDYGDADTVAADLAQFGELCEVHDEDGKSKSREAKLSDEAVSLAIQQGMHFDSARSGVGALLELSYPRVGIGWLDRSSDPASYMPSEAIMGRAVMEARLAFENNKRAEELRNLKSGRLDRRAIGKRAPIGDDRMFYKRNRPGKKDYFFAIGVDVSGSTSGYSRNPRILRAVFAQATLLSRLGHRFAIYGMTGGRNADNLYDPEHYLLNDVWVLKVKDPDEPWALATQRRLANLRPCAENFDGHNMEYLRKVLDKRTETSRGIIYYTDGEMPARNAAEELSILTNELATCNKRGYAVLAVGINTDSPRQYGLNTVQVDADEDIVLVTKQLGEHLSKR